MTTFIAVLAALLVREALVELYGFFKTKSMLNRIVKTMDKNHGQTETTLENILKETIANTNRITKD